MVKNDIRGPQRPPLRQNVHRGEHLKRAYDAGNEDKQRGWLKQGQGDVPEGLVFPGAIDFGRVVEVYRNPLQTGQKD